MTDEGVHEIHLNGKQLVFMFMATTVVAVVIFLSGVMVGRGVPARRAAAEAIATATSAAVDPTAPADAGRAVPARTTATSDAPVTTQETLTYAERLEAPTPPRETLKAIGDAPAAASTGPSVDKASATARASTSARATADTPATQTDMALAEPPGGGWAVQVMAVPAAQRADAEALARRLDAKGYPSYVVPRGNRFAVRVGKYPNQRDAEAVSARLKKEEQFDPWVTR